MQHNLCVELSDLSLFHDKVQTGETPPSMEVLFNFQLTQPSLPSLAGFTLVISQELAILWAEEVMSH